MLIHQKKCRGSDHFVYIRGKWLNRGYMYLVKISSLVLYMCIYISKKYLVHIAEFETGVLWQNRCIAIDTARNPRKRRMNNCLKPSLERLTAREWKIRTEFFLPFPTVYFIVSSPIKNLYRTLKIILKVWNFLWKSLDIDPDIYVMFLSLLHWNKTIILAH